MIAADDEEEEEEEEDAVEDDAEVARMLASERLPDDAAPRTSDAASSGADSSGDCMVVGMRPRAVAEAEAVAVVLTDGADCADGRGCCCRCCCPATGRMDF